MRAVIQRVSGASVSVNNNKVSSIEYGLLVLLGIESEDNIEDAQWLVKKIVSLRIFSDKDQNMNLNIQNVNGNILLVSQFTLHAKIKKGNRPSFIKAAKPAIAEKLYLETKDLFEVELKRNIQHGIFGAMMDVRLVNEGPVTIIIDSKNKE